MKTLMKIFMRFGVFMIDESQQGKGYGKASLLKAIEMIKTYPHGKADKIYLSYVPGNETGSGLYKSVGFVETGNMDRGEVVMVYDLKEKLGEIMFGLDRKIFKGAYKYFIGAGVSIFFAAVFQLLSPIIIKLIIDVNIEKVPVEDPILARIGDLLFSSDALMTNLFVAAGVIVFFRLPGAHLYFKGKLAAIGAEKSPNG